ncbi:MAG TPA: ROK family protein [Anaerolineales bacterium]
MTTKSTADHVFVRELNLALVMRLIYEAAPLSRAQVASKTGLNKSTVSSLVSDLLERHLIHETGFNSIGAGRPATQLEVNAAAGAVVAVQLGVDFVAAALVDFVGRVLWRKQIGVGADDSQQETIRQTRALVDEAVDLSRKERLPVLGLSFAMPGTVDLEKGELIFAPNLKWRDVPFRKIFSMDHVKVYVENDANAAAVGEHLFGGAQHVRDFIFVFAGVGLGGGLFLNDRLYRGKGGHAGEIGHTAILAEPLQQQCQCGNLGCWETYANQASIFQRVQKRLDSAPGVQSRIPVLMAERKTPLSLPIIKQAADDGDEVARGALSDAGSALGTGMAGLINILNPEKIILGGPVSIAGDYLLPSIRKSAEQRAMPGIVAQTEINLSAFGPDASLIGAAAVVIDDILGNPTEVEKEVMDRGALQAVSARSGSFD